MIKALELRSITRNIVVDSNLIYWNKLKTDHLIVGLQGEPFIRAKISKQVYPFIEEDPSKLFDSLERTYYFEVITNKAYFLSIIKLSEEKIFNRNKELLNSYVQFIFGTSI